MYQLFNHLWQTTLFAAVIGVVAMALRQHSARTRYWLWFAASIKFLVPFSVLVSLGDRIEIPVGKGQPPMAALTVEAISTGFSPAPVMIAPQASQWPLVCALIWAGGALSIGGRAVAGDAAQPEDPLAPAFERKHDRAARIA